MVSEVQSLVGRLHCSGPKVSRTSWRKVVGKGKLLNPWVRSRESLSERSHGKHKPQGHVPSDLLPPVTPHLPLLPTSPFKLIIHQMHWPTDYVTILIIHSLHLWTFLHCLKHEFLGTPPIPTVMRTISKESKSRLLHPSWVHPADCKDQEQFLQIHRLLQFGCRSLSAQNPRGYLTLVCVWALVPTLTVPRPWVAPHGAPWIFDCLA